MSDSMATFHVILTKYFAFHDIPSLEPLIEKLLAELKEEKEKAV